MLGGVGGRRDNFQRRSGALTCLYDPPLRHNLVACALSVGPFRDIDSLGEGDHRTVVNVYLVPK